MSDTPIMTHSSADRNGNKCTETIDVTAIAIDPVDNTIASEIAMEQNLRFKVGLNHKVVGKADRWALSGADAWTPEETTLEGLSAHITKGHPWMPAVLDDGSPRNASGANRAQVVAIDIDNTRNETRLDADGQVVLDAKGKPVKDKIYHHELTLEEALEHPFIAQYCGLIQPSASHKEDWNKFRLVFVLPSDIESSALIRICNRYIVHVVGVGDPSCKDSCRFYYGAPGSAPRLLQEVTLPEAFVSDAIAWDTEVVAQQKAAQAIRQEYLKTLRTDSGDKLEQVRSALSYIASYTPGQGRYNDLIVMCAGVVNDLGTEGESLLEEWGGFGPETLRKVQGLDRTATKTATLRSLFYFAKQEGYRFPKREFTPEQKRAYKKMNQKTRRLERSTQQRSAASEDTAPDTLQSGAILLNRGDWIKPEAWRSLVDSAEQSGGRLQPEGASPEALSIEEFILEIPQHWENLPAPKVSEALDVLFELGWDYLDEVLCGALLAAAKQSLKSHHKIQSCFINRAFTAARKATGADDDKRSMADQLIDIGQSPNINYFKTPDDAVYADVAEGNVRKTLAIRSKAFKQYLRSELFEKTQKSPGADAVSQAVDTLEALGVKGSNVVEVSNRIAKADGEIYIDLANDAWEAVEVSANSWRVTQTPAARFKRGAASPMTIEGTGNLADLLKLKTLCGFDDDAWAVVLTFLVQWLYPSKGYPILGLMAAPGTGKSTITKALKTIVDPSPVMARGSVGDVRSFAIHAVARHLIAIDNLSGLTAEQSDILCRAATGAGHTERTLHTDDEETTFTFCNPLILNGIGAIASRSDLLDRMVAVQLHKPAKRLPEAEFAKRLAEIQPSVTAGLFTLLSQVMAVLPSVEGLAPEGERFAGFVELGLAIEKVMNWEPGAVLRLLATRREEAHIAAIESSPVGEALYNFMETRPSYSGTASMLLEQLTTIVPEKLARSKYWPSDARGLSTQLDRLTNDFAAMGWQIVKKRANGVRLISIEQIETTPAPEPRAVVVEPVATAPQPTPEPQTAGGEEVVAEFEFTYDPDENKRLGTWEISDAA